MQLHSDNVPDEGFLRLDAILRLIPVCRSTWWGWVSSGRAPQPIKLSANVTVWRTLDIRNLIRQLGEPATAERSAPRLFGPGPRLDGVSLAAFRKLGSEKQVALVADWKERATAMMRGADSAQRRPGRCLLNRAIAWERLVQQPVESPVRRDARKKLGLTP